MEIVNSNDSEIALDMFDSGSQTEQYGASVRGYVRVAILFVNFFFRSQLSFFSAFFSQPGLVAP